MSNVTVLRPYAPSKTLRQMERARVAEAVGLLLDGDRDGWSRLKEDANRIGEEAARAERWESECELSRQAAARILAMALELTEREGESA